MHPDSLALWSETVGFLVFVLLPSWEGLDFLFDSLGSYLRISRLSKLRLCFYPNLGITIAVRIIAVFRDFSVEADVDGSATVETGAISTAAGKGGRGEEIVLEQGDCSSLDGPVGA
ncbi:hypothetical protein MTO96_037621 [Rhipicephalus appendiculatus]